jgi:hypothetical protein
MRKLAFSGIFLILWLVALILLMGCIKNSRASSVLLPTATSRIQPLPTASSMPTFTAPPSDTPAMATQLFQIPANSLIVRIKNVGSGSYLYESAGQASLGMEASSALSSQWIIEDYQGSKRIRNCASGNYLSIEHLQPFVEVIPIEAVWMSPRWTFQTDTASGTVIFQNVWHTWQSLYASDGKVSYRGTPSTTASSQWILETLNGLALASGTATPVVTLPTPEFHPVGSRGATVPWIEYEAEKGQTSGQILTPDRTFGTIASESSGRSAVQLNKTGDYVQFRALQAANSVVVRFVIPDSQDGTGLDATLSLYVNNAFRQKLNLTSRYAWSYGGEQFTLNTPAAGGAHHFYDEARALVGGIPAGATVKLQKDAGDDAAYYVVDLVDLEQVAPPKTMPAGYLSITDFGATPNNGSDAGPAIQAAIDQARLQKTGVWIPEGTFESSSRPFEVADVTIQGAGMWYSTIHGLYARFNCVGNNCRYFDFAILGETITRDDTTSDNGFNGGAGTGSRLENIWVEHTKVGYWVGNGSTDGLVIINSRFRDLYADGVNFCNGTSNSVVENSHFRNTGDDALASWSPQGSGINTNNVFRFNTVQVPWRANCFAIYGGADNRIEDNLCYDVVTYPGILVAQQFNSNPFSGTTVIQRNSLIRAGGPMFNDQHGALKIWADQGEISGLIVRDNLIDSPTFSGIELEGSYPITATMIDQVDVQRAGTYGIVLHSDLSGEVTFISVTISASGEQALLNYSPKLKFNLIKGIGNIGW